MAINTNIYIHLSDAEFRVKAFAEYCVRAQERYANLLKAISDTVDVVDDEAQSYPSDESVDEFVRSLMVKYGLPEAPVALGSAYSTTTELLKFFCLQSIDEIKSVEGIDISNAGLFDARPLKVQSVIGNRLPEFNVSCAEVTDKIKANYHSIVALSAGVSAYAETMHQATANTLAIFNDKMADIFKDVHNDISSTSQYIKGLLQDRDPINFLVRCIDVIGINSEAEATSDDYSQDMSDISQYTGASPAGPLDFSAASKAGSTIAKVTASVVCGVVRGLISTGKKIFGFAVNKLKELTIDPNDLEVIDGNGFGTVDGFSWNSTNSDRILIKAINFTSLDHVDLATGELSSFVGKWVAMKTKFGEICLQMTEVTPAITALNDVRYNIGYKASYKPRVLNIKAIDAAMSKFNDCTLSNHKEVEEFLKMLEMYGSELYNVAGLSERDVMMGLSYARYLDMSIMSEALHQMNGDEQSSLVKIIGPSSSKFKTNIPETVTNLDWLRSFSGYDPAGKQFLNYTDHCLVGGAQFNVDVLVHSVLASFCQCLIYERLHPTEETPFVPYSNNHVNFENPSYRIRTDDTNKEAFSKFMTTAIIVATAALVATAAVVAIKKITRARYFRRAQKVGELDNKMWSGKKLSASEQKRYIRSKKKLDKSSLISKGLVSMNDTTIPVTAGEIQTIIRLISGNVE